MELVMTLLILVLVAMCAARWGADSRPIDADRPTRWWPATPRDWPAAPSETARDGASSLGQSTACGTAGSRPWHSTRVMHKVDS